MFSYHCCRTPSIRWNYVAKNFAQVRRQGGRCPAVTRGGLEVGEAGEEAVALPKTCVLLCLQALGCLLYACFILGRLCVPVFANMSREPFSTRALLLSILHATGPGKQVIMVAKGCAPPRGRLVRESFTLLSP